MAEPIRPGDLFNHARLLLLVGDARIRLPFPQETTVTCRRAVSSAYYALFHAITLASASLFAPSDDSRYELVRWYRHGDLKRVTAWIHGGSPPEGLEHNVDALRADERVRTISASFQRLSKAREDADYNHTAAFDQNYALDLVGMAKRAADLVEGPAFADSPEGRQFLGLLALRARGGGS